MTIKELQAELRREKRELRSLLRAAGSDLGCDGTGVEADARREAIRGLEWEIEQRRETCCACGHKVQPRNVRVTPEGQTVCAACVDRVAPEEFC